MLGRDAVVIVSTNSEQKRNSDVTYPFRPDSNFWYLTGFTEPDAIAVFSKESYVMFLRPKDETKEIWNGIRLGVALAPETLLVDQAYDIDTFFDNIDSFTQKRSVIYFDAPGSGGWKDNSSTNIHNQRIHSLFESSLKPLNPCISEMRLIKDKEEVKNMQDAADLASEAHMSAMRVASPGLYEHNVASVFDSQFTNGNSEHSYPPIVASGENACILHYNENNQELQDGDLLLIDAGCEINGYASDITRTYAYDSGSDFAALIAAMDVVQLELVAGGGIGKSPVDLHVLSHLKIAQILRQFDVLTVSPEEAFDKGITGTFYPHGLGHHLGCNVHDRGSNLANAQGDLLPAPEKYPKLRSGALMVANQIHTVEPGVYFIPALLEKLRQGEHGNSVNWSRVEDFIPFGGIRIEDNIVVHGDGSLENLTRDAFRDIS